MFPSYLQVGKNGFQLFRAWEKMVALQLFRSSQLLGARKKIMTLLFGDQKMQFTTVRSKEKDYDIYLKSEKLVHIQQEHEKNVSQLFASGEKWFLAISSQQTLLQLFRDRKKWIPAIWRSKNVVHNCQEQGKRL